MESAQKLLADLFTTGNPQPIYEAYFDQDQIDAEVLASIVQKIKTEKGDFTGIDGVVEDKKDKTKFAGNVNLAKGSVRFEIQFGGNKIRNLSFGSGQEPDSIPSKLLATRGVEFISQFLTRNAGARGLMSEIFIEQTPLQKFINDMHMETSRIGFGKLKSAKADATSDTLALDKSSGVPSAKVNFTVEFESATTKADVTFGITGFKAEITDYNFATSIISGGKLTEGQGKQQAALVLQTLFDQKIREFLNGSLHRDLLAMFDAKVLGWHVKDVTDSIGALKAPLDQQKNNFTEQINGDHVMVGGSVSAENSNLEFCFEWNKCSMSAFNWAVEDKSVYQRSSIDIEREYFETRTTTFLETTKNSWIGSADDDIMPDLRDRDEMNRKKLDLRDLLDLDEILETSYEGNEAVFTFNAFEREVALKTKITLGGRVLEGTVNWFVDQLRAYITDFEFTKTAEDSKAPIDIADLNLGADSDDDKYEKAKNFDFNWDD